MDVIIRPVRSNVSMPNRKCCRSFWRCQATGWSPEDRLRHMLAHHHEFVAEVDGDVVGHVQRLYEQFGFVVEGKQRGSIKA